MKILKFTLLLFSLLFLISITSCDNCDANILKTNTWVLESYGPKASLVSALAPGSNTPPGTGIVSLSFDDTTGKVNGNDGCNAYFGDFTQDKCNLKFGLISSTKMLCQTAIMGQVASYMDIFTAATTFSTSNNKLEIATNDGRVLIYRKQ